MLPCPKASPAIPNILTLLYPEDRNALIHQIHLSKVDGFQAAAGRRWRTLLDPIDSRAVDYQGEPAA